MWTVEDLKENRWRPVNACWIIWEGHRVCKFARWMQPGSRSYTYVFTPDWETWKRAGKPDIDGLPMEEVVLGDYVFYEHLPAFYYKRYVPVNREDWEWHARRLNMDLDKERDSWDMMIAAKGMIHEDRFTVEACGTE